MAGLTSGGRGLGVGEDDNAVLALVDELLEGRLGAVVGLDLTAKAVELEGLANVGLAGSSGLGGAIGGLRLDVVHRLFSFCGGGLDGAGGSFFGLGGLGLGAGLLLRSPLGGGRRSLALAELNHGGQ